MENSKLLNKIIKQVMGKEAKIIDDFGRVYLAGRKLTKKEIKKLELVIKQGVMGERIYHFQLKRGRPKCK